MYVLTEFKEDPISMEPFKKTRSWFSKMETKFKLVLVKITVPGVVVPSLLMSFFAYYKADLGKDAFILPSPMW